MARTTLVTGGAGFIGSHLVERLLAMGETVVVLDNLSSGKRENVPAAAHLVTGDILDGSLVESLVKDADSVFHLAAIVSVQECIKEWDFGHEVNLGAAIRLFRAISHAAKTRKLPLIYASSAAIYGDRSGSECSEDDLPGPISPYGVDKLGCEHQARAMASIFGLRSVGLRFFNVYGPRQDPRSPYAGVISRFCENRLTDSAHTIFGDGLQRRDFIYVLDVVDGLIKARDFCMGNSGAHVSNICTGKQTSLIDLAKEIDYVADRGPSEIVYEDARLGDIRTSLGNADLARSTLKFEATTTIRSGLSRLWDTLAPQNESDAIS